MSIIAWDGKTLAADRRAAVGNTIRTTRKIFRAGDCLVGYTGTAAGGEELLHWFKDGADPAAFPPGQRDLDRCGYLFVVRRDGVVLSYEGGPYPTESRDPFTAAGTGRDFAIAAMHLGCDAVEAVRIASLYDTGCGNGVDVLTFAD